MTIIPFELKGKIYRSPMPFGEHDPERTALQEFIENNISVVVPLASIEECEKKAGMDLHRIYREKGFEVVALPVEDYETPDVAALRRVIDEVTEHALSGRNVVVHCSAGQGRTGTFMACMARHLLGLSGDEAIRWVRRYIPGAVETDLQEKLVREYIVEPKL